MSLFALAVTVILVLLDAERRSERRFLANLGISRAGIGAVALLTALGLEVLLLFVAEPLSQFIAGGLLDR